MGPSTPPTLKELKSIRSKLLLQMDKARLIFPTGRNSAELLTSKVALESIQELIADLEHNEAA